MAQYKAVQFFEDFAGRGFTETWYLSASNLQAALNSYNTVAKQRDLLTTFSTTEIRVSDVTNPKLEAAFYYDAGINPSVNQPNLAEDAWFATADTASGQKRSVMLRATQDDWVIRTNTRPFYAVQPGMRTAFNDWVGLMLQQGIQIKIQDPAAPKMTLGLVTLNGSDLLSISVTDAAGITGVDTIVVRGFKGDLASANGVYTPKQFGLAGGSLVLNKDSFQSSDVEPAPTGIVVKKKVAAYTNVTNISLRKPVTRKVGRNFGQRPGKSR